MFFEVLVYSLAQNGIVECSSACMPESFPYVTGLLSFREGPVILAALRRIQSAVDVVIFDGQGIAHPRGLGIAAHIGLWLDVPSVGVAKSLLVGSHHPVGPDAGSKSLLMYKRVKIGYALRTRDNVKPVYISPGNRIGLAGTLRMVLRCCKGVRLPEPVRLAHTVASLASRNVQDDVIVTQINRTLEKRSLRAKTLL